MLTEEELVQEFIDVVDRYYPRAGRLLRRCHVRLIVSHWGKPPRELQYIGIYCPDNIVVAVKTYRNLMREIAQNIGLNDVVCLNATRLLRDPLSKVRESDPRFWLELTWVVSRENY